MGCELVLFPELTLCGYPPEDLLLHRGLRSRVEAAFAMVRDEVRGIAVVRRLSRVRRATRSTTARRSCATAKCSRITARWRCRTTPCSTRSATSTPGDARDRRRSRRRQARPDHLRGRLGARAVPRAGGGRAPRSFSSSTARRFTRAQQQAREQVLAMRAQENVAAADLRQHGRRPRRARVRRRLGRRRRQGRGAVPRAAVRGRPLRRRPRAHGRPARAACRRGDARAAARRARLSRARARHARLRREERLRGRRARAVGRRRFGADADDRRRRARRQSASTPS